jgi:hypothetical protein
MFCEPKDSAHRIIAFHGQFHAEKLADSAHGSIRNVVRPGEAEFLQNPLAQSKKCAIVRDFFAEEELAAKIFKFL